MFDSLLVEQQVRPTAGQLLREKAVILGLLLGIGITMMLAVLMLQVQARYYTGRIDSLVEVHSSDVARIHASYADSISAKDAEIEALTAEVTTLQTQVTDLVSASEAEFATLKEYWYVFREAPADGGVTADLIVYTDQVAQEKDINAHLVWGIIDHESSYIAEIDNSTSSARGLGQFLESTARSIYERYLGYGEGTYTHEMAYDPYTNIDLITEYLVYLRDMYNGDVAAMLRSYSGSTSDDYYNAVRADVRSVNESIDTAYYT